MKQAILKHVFVGAWAVCATAATAAGSDHRSWDGWSAASPSASSAPIAGALTSVTAIPSSGTATYKGAAIGAENRGGNIGAITASAALSADFGARSLTGSFNDMKRPLSGTPLGGSATPVNAALAASWGADNRVSGTLTAPTSNNGVMSGKVNAAFFGLTPAANIAGTWTLAGGNTTAAGVFAGRKQ